MITKRGLFASFLSGAVLVSAAPAAGEARRAEVSVSSWKAPGMWIPEANLTDQTGPMPFVPIAPCRVADTRAGFGFSGGYGPPSIGAGTSRTFDIAASGCSGIPSDAAAYSFNFTVTNTAGPGFIQAYPAGGSAGGSSAVNYTGAGQTVANAAVTPAGSGANAGKITITVGVSTTDVIIDVNGYYSGKASSGQGMSLASTGGNSALAVYHTGGAQGIEATTNTTGYALWAVNNATDCMGACGAYVQSKSTVADTFAVAAATTGTTARNVAVFGSSAGAGSGTDHTSYKYAAGVLGEASNNAGTALSAGVVGLSWSPHLYAAGVYGEAIALEANGGFFRNLGGAAPINTFLGYNSNVAMGVNTNGQIFGSLGLQISGGTKNFVTPHPEDPSREIAYVSAEGPTSDVFFRGHAELRNGTAVIVVPDHFRLVARQDSYEATVTAVGSPADLWIEAQGPDGIVVRGPGNERFNYVVWGERDEFRGQEPIRANTHFTPEALEKTQALRTLPESTRAILVKNGTLNADGTYNQATAQRLGWRVPEPEVVTSTPAPGVGLSKK